MYIQLVCILPMDLLARAEEIGQSGRGLGEEHTVEAVGHVILIGVGGGEKKHKVTSKPSNNMDY